jgi:putative membrane protein
MDLGLRRTFLAYDRTLMAWIRTAVSLITFGFSIYKFFQYLIKAEDFRPVQTLIGPRQFAIGMIGLGVIGLAAATVQYRQTVKMLKEERGEEYRSLAGIFAATVCIFGLGLLAAVVLRL